MIWPATADELKAAGYRSIGRSRCSCGALIIWAHTPKGGKMPLERVGDTLSSRQPALTDRFQAHFSSCPHAARHRRRTA